MSIIVSVNINFSLVKCHFRKLKRNFMQLKQGLCLSFWEALFCHPIISFSVKDTLSCHLSMCKIPVYFANNYLKSEMVSTPSCFQFQYKYLWNNEMRWNQSFTVYDGRELFYRYVIIPKIVERKGVNIWCGSEFSLI